MRTLDLLRALVVVGLVLFHSAVIFGAGEFPVKAPTEHRLATVLPSFGATWGMPLLFVISGMGVRYSLGSRGAPASPATGCAGWGSRCWWGWPPWCRSRSGWGCAAPATPAPWPASTRASGTCGPASGSRLGLTARRVPSQGTPAVPAADRPGLARRLGAAVGDAVLAFYLLHEPVVVAVASVVLSWRLGAGVQYLLISGVSLAVTLLACELVRRGRLARFLFGLKPAAVPSRT